MPRLAWGNSGGQNTNLASNNSLVSSVSDVGLEASRRSMSNISQIICKIFRYGKF